MGLCVRTEREPLREEVLIANPTTDHICDVPMMAEMQFPQEDGGSTMTPEENEDRPCQETEIILPLTDNGNYVALESGKTEILSQQETQTLTLS